MNIGSPSFARSYQKGKGGYNVLKDPGEDETESGLHQDRFEQIFVVIKNTVLDQLKRDYKSLWDEGYSNALSGTTGGAVVANKDINYDFFTVSGQYSWLINFIDMHVRGTIGLDMPYTAREPTWSFADLSDEEREIVATQLSHSGGEDGEVVEGDIPPNFAALVTQTVCKAWVQHLLQYITIPRSWPRDRLDTSDKFDTSHGMSSRLKGGAAALDYAHSLSWWTQAKVGYLANYLDQNIPEPEQVFIRQWPQIAVQEPGEDEIRALMINPELTSIAQDDPDAKATPVQAPPKELDQAERRRRLLAQQGRFKEGMLSPSKKFLMKRIRNSTVVRDAKNANIINNGFLTCENKSCGLQPANPNKVEGKPFFPGMNEDNARAMIQAHHIVPMQEKPGEYVITIEDLLCLCKNCHDVWHIRGNKSKY